MDTTFDTVQKIMGMFTGGAFKIYVDHIRFPFFRNLEKNTRIDFKFPLTVFVGQNGCGKSSTLHALYGAPEGQSVGDYWFSTATDPIKETPGGERNCFIYGYKDSEGRPVDPEVLKTRIRDDANPDLWETSEPLKKYGMRLPKKRGRTPPIKKTVLYLDFRQIVSAFDKALHNSQEERGGRIQKFLRKRSEKLKRAFEGQVYQVPPSNQVIPLTEHALKEASSILGRSYSHVDLVNHKFFGQWGYSVKYGTDHSSYSEAFAGSGEIAVVVLVSRILEANAESLILLDEPETSLHPGAQKGLKKFLFEQIIRKRHQIIISSHSPTLVEGLPPTALKAFRQMPDGKFKVISDLAPTEAFFFLGQTLTDKKRIHVEDVLAKNIVERVLHLMGEPTQGLFEVRYSPGGCAAMRQDAVFYSRDLPSRDFLLLDGDANRNVTVTDPDALLNVEQNNNLSQAIVLLDAEIKKVSGDKIKFTSDGGVNGADQVQQRDLRKSYLRYYAKNVFYLPFVTPEQELWSEEVADDFLNSIKEPSKQATLEQIVKETDPKRKFALISKKFVGHDSKTGISTIHQMFLTAWINRNSVGLERLKTVLELIKSAP